MKVEIKIPHVNRHKGLVKRVDVTEPMAMPWDFLQALEGTVRLELASADFRDKVRGLVRIESQGVTDQGYNQIFSQGSWHQYTSEPQ